MSAFAHYKSEEARGHMYKRPDHISMTRMIRACVAVAAIAVLSACVAQTRNHGYVPSDSELGQITVGTDTMQTVSTVVGRPSAEGLLDATGWYYVRSQFETLGAFAPKEIDRQVVAISFDGNGVVSNIERFGLEDGARCGAVASRDDVQHPWRYVPAAAVRQPGSHRHERIATITHDRAIAPPVTAQFAYARAAYDLAAFSLG